MRIDYSPLHKRLFEPYKHTLFIFDGNTYNHHRNKIIALELNKSTKYDEYIIPHGESSKDFTMVEEICEFLSSKNFPRKDSCIIAVGGGVVGCSWRWCGRRSGWICCINLYERCRFYSSPNYFTCYGGFKYWWEEWHQ